MCILYVLNIYIYIHLSLYYCSGLHVRSLYEWSDLQARHWHRLHCGPGESTPWTQAPWMATISSLVGSEWVRRNSEQFVSTFTFRHHSSPGLCWNNLISIALSGPSFAEREGCRRKSPCGEVRSVKPSALQSSGQGLQNKSFDSNVCAGMPKDWSSCANWMQELLRHALQRPRFKSLPDLSEA